MKYFVLIIMVFFCSIQMSYAQEEDGVVSYALPVRNSLKYNRFAIQPTFSFVREDNQYISIYNKREWVQFDDAPQTYLLGYTGKFSDNIGAGVGLFQQNYGVLTTFGGVLNFAYNAQLQRDSNLTFALNLGVYKSGLNNSSVVTNYPDPSLNTIPSNMMLTVNPGINYGTGFMDYGVSINNLLLYNIKSSAIIQEDPRQTIQAHVMYTGFFNTSGFFDDSKFSGLLRSEIGKDITSVSGIAMLTVPKGIWAQVGYNTVYGASGGLGINITEQIGIEYNFEKALGDLTDFGPSHEITIAFKIINRSNFATSNEDDAISSLFEQSRKKRVLASNQPKMDADTRAQLAAESAARRQEARERAQERAAVRNEAAEALRAEAAKRTEARLAAELKAKELAEAEAQAKREAAQQLKAAQEAEAKLAAERKAQQDAEAARLAAADKAKALELAEIQAKRDAAAKLQADKEAKARLAAQEKAREEAEKARLAAAELKAKQDAEAAKIAAAEAQAKLDAEKAQARKELAAAREATALEAKQIAEAAEARDRSSADIKAKQQQEAAQAAAALKAKQLADAEAKAKADAIAKAKAEEEAKNKLAAEARAKQEAEAARIAAAEKAKQLSDTEAKAKQEADAAKRAAEEKAQQLAAAEAKAKQEALAKAKAEQDAKAKLAAEAKAKQEADAAKRAAEEKAQQLAAAEAKAKQEAKDKLAAETKAKNDAEAAKAAAAKKAKELAEQESKARLAAEQKAKADAEAAQARKLAAEEAAKTPVIPDGVLNPKDANARSMKSVTDMAASSKNKQDDLLAAFNEIVASKDQDLKDLKEENDLSERGIVKGPKAFKSISEENNKLQAVRNNLEEIIASNNERISELDKLYQDRMKTPALMNDETTAYYRRTISSLKAEQAKAIQTRTQLNAKLRQIEEATEIERKRRIKKAAYTNEQDRYVQDRAALNLIKKQTGVSAIMPKTEDFDFGEEQSSNIQILKNIPNVNPGFYIVVAVHNDVDKRDEFLKKMVASGQSNVDFFFDVSTSKYFIYYQKYDNIDAATNALKAKGSKPYNAKMSIIKIEK